MAFIGNQPALAYTSFAVQHFTTSATTSYTLNFPVANENEIRLVINNVVQQPGASYAYSASGTTLTLTAATTVSDTMYAVFLGKAVQTVNPPNNSVGASQLADGAVTAAKVASGAVVQVVSTTKTDTFSASLSSSSGFTDVTGLSVSITPSSASNKILVIASINYGVDGIRAVALRLVRNSTAINIGTGTLGSRTASSTSAMGENYDSNRGENSVINHLDSPATTSSVTYKIQIGILESTANTARVNTSGADGDFSYIARSASTITVMEIKA